MKIKVYQSEENKYIEMEVLAQYKYTGESDPLDFINGKIYNCVGYDKEHDMVRLVDETGEDYLYYLVNFEKVEESCEDKENGN